MTPVDDDLSADSPKPAALAEQQDRPPAPGLEALDGLDDGDTGTLRPVLAVVLQGLGDRFDPARLQFIQALADRALQQRPTVAAMLEQKAQRALCGYVSDYLAKRKMTDALVEQLLTVCPESAAQISRLFESGDFDALQTLAARAMAGADNNPGILGSLNRDMLQTGDAGAECASPTLEDELRLQELQIMQSQLGAAKLPGNGAGSRPGAGGFDELSVMHRFRTSLRKHNSQQRITRAIQDGPENPGPLNAQALVVRTLSTMRELSPSYADRFVSYMDTLLWLERAAKAAEPAKKKATRRRKS